MELFKDAKDFTVNEATFVNQNGNNNTANVGSPGTGTEKKDASFLGLSVYHPITLAAN